MRAQLRVNALDENPDRERTDPRFPNYFGIVLALYDEARDL